MSSGIPSAGHMATVGYEVHSELGRSRSAVVLRVRRIADGREYAMKLADRRSRPCGPVLEAFRREAVLLSGVNHPTIARVHEVGQVEGRPYLIMDLVEGTTLNRILLHGPIPAPRVAEMGRGLLDILSAAHQAGIVHRDLKPENIILDPDDFVHLVDFGLATCREDENEAEDRAVGTLRYAAPEQAGTLRRPVDHRSDLYALGVVLHECLRGEPPFVAAEVGELLRLHAVVAPPDLVAAGAPPALAAVVDRLLAKDPDDRYQTAAAARRDLDRLHTGSDNADTDGAEPADAAPPPTAPPGRDAPWRTLVTWWRRARDGRPTVCTLRGGDGSGKSLLAERLATLAEQSGGLVLIGTAAATDPSPLLPLRHALEVHLRVGRARSDDEARRRLRDLQTAARGHGPVLSACLPLLAEDDPPQAPPAGSDDVSRDHLTLAAADLLAELARSSGGLLLVIDDGEWADRATTDVLDHLCRLRPPVPILVVVTCNDDTGGEGHLARLVDVVDIHLAPLDDGAITAIVHEVVPGLAPDHPLMEKVVTTANGNPLVARECLRAIVDAGLVAPDWGDWTLEESGLATLDLPADALGLLISRLRNLSEPDRDVLRTAATAGPTFDPDLLVTADAGHTEGDVREALAEAAAYSLVEDAGEGLYRFVHRRLHTAVLAELVGDERSRRHAALARALADDPASARDPALCHALARHSMAAGSLLPTGFTIDACIGAAELMLTAGAPAEAVDLLDHAVALSDGPAFGPLRLLGAALTAVGRFDEAQDRLEQALEGQTWDLRRAEILWLQAEAHRSAGRTEQGLAAAERAMAELGAASPTTRSGRIATTAVRLVLGALYDTLATGGHLPPSNDAARQNLLSSLHQSAALSHVGDDRTRAPTQVIQARYWASRTGQGRPFVESQVLYGALWAEVGVARLADRAFRRARRDPSADEPAQAAALRYGPTWADYATYRCDVDTWLWALEESAPGLDPVVFGESAAALMLALTAEGRETDAVSVRDLARDRLRSSHDPGHPVQAMTAALAAVAGRHPEAASELDDHRLRLDGSRSGAASLLDDITIVVLWERGEIGEPFDAAVRTRSGSRWAPLTLRRARRWPRYLIARTRIEQFRISNDADRPARLAAAHRAVRRLARCGGDDLGRGWSAIARADLQLALGEPLAAIRGLDRLDHGQRRIGARSALDATLIRTTAWHRLGDRDRARWQAELASSMASEGGWRHRLEPYLEMFDELGLDTADDPGPARAGRGSLAGATTAKGPGRGVDRQRLEALQQVGAAASRVLDPDSLVRIVLDELVSILHADRAHLFVPDPARQLTHHLGRDTGGRDLPEADGYAASLVDEVGRTREPLVVAGTDQAAALGSTSAVQYGLRSLILAPLLLDDRLVGVLYLDSRMARGIFSEDDADILLALGGHIALSLETARAAQLEIWVQAAHQQRDLAEHLRRALEDMSDTLEPDVVLARLLAWTGKLVAEADAWIVTTGEEPTVLTIASDGSGLRRRPCGGTGGPDLVTALEQPTVFAPPTVPAVLDELSPDTGSWLAVPLRAHAGAIGALVLGFPTDSGAWDSAVELIGALVTQGLTAYDNAALFAQVQEMAVVDDLTGISNRRRFHDLAGFVLAEASRYGRPATAAMIDIDHFKAVNDSHGHPTGDDVIRGVARRLQEALRTVDVLARHGGEEFAVALPDTDLAAGRTAAERMRRAVEAEPIATRTGPVVVTVSVGLAAAEGRHELDDVLTDADRALYVAKQSGRNRVEVAAAPSEADPPSVAARARHHGGTSEAVHHLE